MPIRPIIIIIIWPRIRIWIIVKHIEKYDVRRKNVSWWRHQMETFSALLAICAGNSPVPDEFPHKGQRRRALMFSLIFAWINGWVNNREAGYFRRYRAHYDVIVMLIQSISLSQNGYFIFYIENKIAFCFKKGCFIGPQNQRFRLKRGCFTRPKSAKRFFFSCLGTSVVNVLVGSGVAGYQILYNFEGYIS